MNLYKSTICAGLIALAGFAQAGIGDIGDLGTSQTVRAAAVIPTTAELSTTFTLDRRTVALHVFADITVGSLSSVSVAPAYAPVGSGNPAGSAYFWSADYGKTVTASGKYHFRVPREALGGKSYFGVRLIGVGTATGSSATIAVVPEIAR